MPGRSRQRGNCKANQNSRGGSNSTTAKVIAGEKTTPPRQLVHEGANFIKNNDRNNQTISKKSKKRRNTRMKNDSSLYKTALIVLSHLLTAVIAIFVYARFAIKSVDSNEFIAHNSESVTDNRIKNEQHEHDLNGNILLHGEGTIEIDDSASPVEKDFFSSMKLSDTNERKDGTAQSCTLYLARSTIPNAGLGMFTTRPFARGDIISHPDEIIIQVPDLNPHFLSGISLLLYDYFWDGSSTGGQYEGSRAYSVVPGLGMLANGHDTLFNARMNSEHIHFDTVGLNRGRDPGAGSNSQYLNPTFVTTTDIPAGGEILIEYGREWFQERREKQRLHVKEHGEEVNEKNESRKVRFKRSVAWIERQGICLDNLKVGPSTIPEAGRGAFTARNLSKDEIIAPIPVAQIIDRRSLEIVKVREGIHHGEDVMERSHQLLLNYCIGHAFSSLLLLPYSPIVNYVNHNVTRANAFLRWSTSSQHPIPEPTQMSLKELGGRHDTGLMLELVASRDLHKDEEILINYGLEWELEWQKHVLDWVPSSASDDFVYSQMLEMENHAIRTEEEQKIKPYPDHIFISCFYDYSKMRQLAENTENTINQRGHFQWAETNGIWSKKNLRPCMLINREQGGAFTVVIRNRFGLLEKDRVPRGVVHIVSNVPNEAIRLSNKLYSTDLHIPEAFRHELRPNGIFPKKWQDLRDD